MNLSGGGVRVGVLWGGLLPRPTITVVVGWRYYHLSNTRCVLRLISQYKTMSDPQPATTITAMSIPAMVVSLVPLIVCWSDMFCATARHT